MSPVKRHLLAALLAVGMVAVLLLLVSLSSPVADGRSPGIVARRIDLAVPAPPPPPRPPPTLATVRQQPRPEVEIRTDRTSSPDSLLKDLSIKIESRGGELSAGRSGGGFGNGAGGFGVKWDGLDLPYLDSPPSVKSAPLVEFPKPLLERGIESMDIRVLIQIDEDGKPTLLDILSTPYPPFDNALRKFVKDVRFTSPTVGGKKVKAVYVWPLSIRAR